MWRLRDTTPFLPNLFYLESHYFLLYLQTQVTIWHTSNHSLAFDSSFEEGYGSTKKEKKEKHPYKLGRPSPLKKKKCFATPLTTCISKQYKCANSIVI